MMPSLPAGGAELGRRQPSDIGFADNRKTWPAQGLVREPSLAAGRIKGFVSRTDAHTHMCIYMHIYICMYSVQILLQTCWTREKVLVEGMREWGGC